MSSSLSFFGDDVFTAEVVRPIAAGLQCGRPGLLPRAVVQPEGAFPVPDAERVHLDTVDRADVGQEQLVCCRARLVANDPRAGVVGLEIDRRRAAVAADVDDRRRVARDLRLGQRVVHALEHGQDHFLLGLRVGKRVFTVGELDLKCAECHWPSGGRRRGIKLTTAPQGRDNSAGAVGRAFFSRSTAGQGLAFRRSQKSGKSRGKPS